MKKLIILLILISANPIFGQSDSLNQAKIDSLCNVLPINLSSTEVIRYGLTYDVWVSNDDIGISIANGWRLDTLIGGGNRIEYWNPYLSYDVDRVEKWGKHQPYTDYVYYRYKNGIKFSGEIVDTLETNYREKLIFKAHCIKGVVQGKGTLTIKETKQVIASFNFENGELVDECIFVNRKTMGEYRITYVKGKSQWTKMIELDKEGKVILVREE